MNFLIFLLFLSAIEVEARFDVLSIDNYPCRPENLKKALRYICDESGQAICLEGWKNPDSMESVFKLNPCLEPICSKGCVNGECIKPNVCACHAGWEGRDCNTCIKPADCLHGSCFNSSFQCFCDNDWFGQKCDKAKCDNCVHGTCKKPHQCTCDPGWTGPNCDHCIPAKGCLHGTCTDQPFTCICQEGWEGTLCNRIVCMKPCQHGFCHGVEKPNGSVEPFCVCNSGWGGDLCNKCRPYWKCPNKKSNACIEPNDCFCFDNEDDDYGLCNKTFQNPDQKFQHPITKMPPIPKWFH